MDHVMYSMERDRVDPVFFAVVPDSFMTPESVLRPQPRTNGEWRRSDETERPVVRTGDRWSF